jgi:hypothetical protein
MGDSEDARSGCYAAFPTIAYLLFTIRFYSCSTFGLKASTNSCCFLGGTGS